MWVAGASGSAAAMATKLMRARQQELKFFSYQKIRGRAEEGGEDEEETHTDQVTVDYGSMIARSSLDLPHGFSVAQSCFSSALKRNVKAFCGRLGKWSIHHKKYNYLHINKPLDPHLSPRAFQEQKSKSKQSLLHYHPIIGLHEHSLPSIPLDPLAFQKQKSKSKQVLILLDYHPNEHSHTSEHEEITDTHLGPQGTTFTCTDGIKSTSLGVHEETKPQEQIPLTLIDYHQPPHNISSIDTLQKKPSLIEGSFEEQSQVVSANQAASKRQSKVLSGISELMLRVTQYSLGLEATPLTFFHVSSTIRSPSTQNPQAQCALG